MANEADESSRRGIGSVRVCYAPGIALALEKSAYVCHDEVDLETMVAYGGFFGLGSC